MPASEASCWMVTTMAWRARVGWSDAAREAEADWARREEARRATTVEDAAMRAARLKVWLRGDWILGMLETG